ncbi:MAG: alpha-hydroxy acid oxidase [Arenicellales bacterium]|jgi:L-lactate dehydrogenase (cytochrome)|nr:alpha-hydroxy acid oxidase [Arenicellales bacterium]MDP6767189.1 alpha-hydroxy acid oxidase [Arenicellales bacterium]MDP7451890.1 alpha-hydroxy acid oxidase [Arenicellales bacterium]MDP7616990.1 alpha-hydroxy acid oxidase [Arenicellales bacterium]
MPRKYYCVDDFRLAAQQRMPRITFDFVDGAAGFETSSRLNREVIEQVRLLPRVLVDIRQRELAKTFLGRTWGLPFGIAPMGMCDLAWPNTDKALAAAAVDHDIPVCLSTFGSSSIEDMGKRSAGNGWFQLYVGPSVGDALDLVQRAEDTGYEYLLLTVDVPVVSARLREQRQGFEAPFRIRPKQLLDFAVHPQWVYHTLVNGVPKPANVVSTGNNGNKPTFTRNEIRGHIDWQFLDQLRERWPGKLILKGVLSTDDAVRIRDAGVDAVYVSNHGGRQLDAAPAAIDMLPEIRQAVGADYPLIFDSGIRSGEGIVKALALGADFVMLGRPFLYASGADGQRGVFRLVDMLKNEMLLALAQIGCTDVSHLDQNVLV